MTRVSTVLALCVAVSFPGCAVNKATGERHLDLYGQDQEIAMGRQADSQIVSSLGIYNDPALQKYIQDLGTKIAATSERPDLPWTFRIVDDPVVNAFALPGGFIYVTRGLLTYVTNEAELTGVVGHEIGHVTAQHTVHRLSEQQVTQGGVILGGIIEPSLQKYGQIVNAGLGLMFLKFSRDDESQADHLGLRYMVRAEADPRELIGVFEMLSRVSQAGGGGRIPEWLATHPDPENRIENIQKELDTFHVDFSNFTVNGAGYLDRTDGVVFGENPRDGFFRTNHFYQPELQFEFEFPSGWTTMNQREAVAAISSQQDAMVQITMAQEGTNQQAAQAFLGQQGVESSPLETSTVNGLPAVSANFRAETEEGVLQGRASFIEFMGHVYQLLGYTTDKLWASYRNDMTRSLGTFRRLTDSQILNAQPMHLKIITASGLTTLAQLAAQQHSPVNLGTLAIINQVDSTASFNAGDRVKMVVGQNLVLP